MMIAIIYRTIKDIMAISELFIVCLLRKGVRHSTVRNEMPLANIFITPHGSASPKPELPLISTANSYATKNIGKFMNPSKLVVILVKF